MNADVIKSLDYALNIVCDKMRIQESKFVTILSNSNIDVVTIGGIIDLLKEDNYISEIVNEFEKEKTLSEFGVYGRRDIYTYYMPTIKGLLFKQNGGYTEDINRTKRKDFNLRIRNSIITTGSLLAGMYSLWKLFSHFDALLSVNLLTFLCVFLFGLIAGIIIYMLILEVLSRKIVQ